MAVTNTLQNSKNLQPAFYSPQAEALAEVVESAVSKVSERLEKRMDEKFARVDEKFAQIDKRFDFMQWLMVAGFGFLGSIIALVSFIS